jgi:putative membrane protein
MGTLKARNRRFVMMSFWNWGYRGAMGWYGWIGPALMLALWAAIIVGIVFFIRAVARQGRARLPREESALDILKKRYARGEINKEEFEQKKSDLA